MKNTTTMKFSPASSVRELHKRSRRIFDLCAKAVGFAGLVGHAVLDQSRRGRKSKPKNPAASRRIRSRAGKAIQLHVLAHLNDNFRVEDSFVNFCLKRKLRGEIARWGGMTALADAPAGPELLSSAKGRERDIEYVVLIVSWLLRARAYPTDGMKPTIENAKGFAYLWIGDYGISKISQIWENYKLVAPYLYALGLETRFSRVRNLKRTGDFVVWVMRFVANPRRVERFLGHASFAADEIREYARDQRIEDFKKVTRIKPSLHRFTPEERAVINSLDRHAEDYGRSFKPILRRPKNAQSMKPDSFGSHAQLE